MLAAQLKGKLTREEGDLEDLLTSNVFGSAQYVPPEDGLIPILSSAESADGTLPLKNLQISGVPEYEFWPRLQEPGCIGCEPDLLIHITQDNGNKLIILVEAKYRSGKSSEADETESPMDQLAREWDNLIILARKTNATPFLLYITADFSYPKKEIEDAQQEFLKKRGAKIGVLWTSWRKLPNLLSAPEHLIIKDLVAILRGQGLIFFEGVSIPMDTEPIKWSFQDRALNFNWFIYPTLDIQWKYQTFILDWNIKAYRIKWRFSI